MRDVNAIMLVGQLGRRATLRLRCFHNLLAFARFLKELEEIVWDTAIVFSDYLKKKDNLKKY